MKFSNILQAPVKICGLAQAEEGKFYRIEEEYIGTFGKDPDSSDCIENLARHTAGGCVRFRTDSQHIGVRVVLLNKDTYYSHMAVTGHSGCDVYFDGNYAESICPKYGFAGEYSGEATCPIYVAPGMHDIQINMPLYNGVTHMEIGIDDGCALLAATPYKIEKPVLFYGSSITQGACASKPGNCYTSMIARHLDFEQRNLGFSDSARGEPKLAEYIAKQPMSAFVMDYDHNSTTAQLRERHEQFFKIVRAANPGIPILLLTKATIYQNTDVSERLNIISTTFANARAAGDNNVYLINGAQMYINETYGECTVDGLHPNDLGFRGFYKAVSPVLKYALGIK